MSTAIVQSGQDLVRSDTGEVVGVSTFSMPDYLASVTSEAAFNVQQQLAGAYDKACLSLIGPNDVQKAEGRTFKKKSAWRKLARHFNISTSVVSVQKEDMNGIFVASVTVRAAGPWGQFAEAVGACGTDEATGRRTITIADAIATAETRATNRAVSNLIAMGEVSAEEMSGKGDNEQRLHATPPSTNSAPEALLTTDEPSCPKCGGRMWDNRLTKRNPKAPDYKCRTRSCDGAAWPRKDQEEAFDIPDQDYLDALTEGE